MNVYIDGLLHLYQNNSLNSLCGVFLGYFKDTLTRLKSSFPVHVLNKVNVQLPQINALLSSFVSRHNFTTLPIHHRSLAYQLI